jgi:hypothetical protein
MTEKIRQNPKRNKRCKKLERRREGEREEYFALGDDAAALFENGGGKKDFFTNHGVVFVIRVVCVSEFSIRPELEFQEFVTEFTSVTNVVTKIELSVIFLHRCHCFLLFLFLSLCASVLFLRKEKEKWKPTLKVQSL